MEAGVQAVMLTAAASLALQVRAERTGEDFTKVDTATARPELVNRIEALLVDGGAR